MTLTVMSLWKPHASEEEVIARDWPRRVRLVAFPGDGSLSQELANTIRVVVGMPSHMTADLVAGLPALEVIHLTGHGVDALCVPAMKALVAERGLTVATASSGAPGIAEFAVMAMIALARRLTPLQSDLLLDGDWGGARKRRRMDGALGGEIAGSRLLIIGYGPLGQELAARAQALGMRVIVVRRSNAVRTAADPVDEMHAVDALDGLLPDADFVVLCTPLTASTRGLLNRTRLSRLRSGAFLVNLSRGSVVDEVAMYELLESGHLAGAAVDVWSSEEGEAGLRPEPSWQRLNIIATPHIAGLTSEARLRALAVVGDNLRRLLDGDVLRNTVDIARGEGCH